MRNLLFIFVFGLMLSLTSGIQIQAQDVPETSVQTELDADKILNAPPAEKVGFFDRILGKVKEGAVSIGIGMIVGLFAKKGWTLIIKKISSKACIVTKEIGEMFIGGSNFFNVLDKSIKSDGKLEENSIKELLAAGKMVIAEANDVIISIKPKNPIL